MQARRLRIHPALFAAVLAAAGCVHGGKPTGDQPPAASPVRAKTADSKRPQLVLGAGSARPKTGVPDFGLVYWLVKGRGYELWGAGEVAPSVGEQFVAFDDKGYLGEFIVREVLGWQGRMDTSTWGARLEWLSHWDREPHGGVVAIGPIGDRPTTWGGRVDPAGPLIVFDDERVWSEVLAVDLDADGVVDVALEAYTCSDVLQHRVPPLRTRLRRDGPPTYFRLAEGSCDDLPPGSQ